MKCPKCGQKIQISPVPGNSNVVRQTCGCGSKIVDKKGRKFLED